MPRRRRLHVASPQPAARHGEPAQVLPANTAPPDGRPRLDGVMGATSQPVPGIGALIVPELSIQGAGLNRSPRRPYVDRERRNPGGRRRVHVERHPWTQARLPGEIARRDFAFEASRCSNCGKPKSRPKYVRWDEQRLIYTKHHAGCKRFRSALFYPVRKGRHARFLFYSLQDSQLA